MMWSLQIIVSRLINSGRSSYHAPMTRPLVNDSYGGTYTPFVSACCVNRLYQIVQLMPVVFRGMFSFLRKFLMSALGDFCVRRDM